MKQSSKDILKNQIQVLKEIHKDLDLYGLINEEQLRINEVILSLLRIWDSETEYTGMELDERQQAEVDLARHYAQKPHGTDGHHRLLLIAKLADKIDALTR